MTRDGVYKIFKKESIDSEQLQKISSVLKHDFFTYYQSDKLMQTKEVKTDYGFATKSELSEVVSAIQHLTKAIERIEAQLPKKKQ